MPPTDRRENRDVSERSPEVRLPYPRPVYQYPKYNETITETGRPDAFRTAWDRALEGEGPWTLWGLQATMDAATQRALAGIPTAGPDSPAGDAVRAYLAEQSRAFLTSGAAAARLRAACRRTSSALAACRPLVDPGWADELAGEVERTAETLGAERDADAVRGRLLAPLDRWIADGRYPDGGAARTRTLLTRMLDRDRSAAHSSATAVLVGPGFHALADRMATLAREVPLTPAAAESCGDVLPYLLTAAYEDLAGRAATLPDPLSSEDEAADDQWLAAARAAEAALHAAELCRPAEVSLAGRSAEDLVGLLARIAEALRDQRGQCPGRGDRAPRRRHAAHRRHDRVRAGAAARGAAAGRGAGPLGRAAGRADAGRAGPGQAGPGRGGPDGGRTGRVTRRDVLRAVRAGDAEPGGGTASAGKGRNAMRPPRERRAGRGPSTGGSATGPGGGPGRGPAARAPGADGPERRDPRGRRLRGVAARGRRARRWR